ncbi:hypothetical protein [Solirubrobacter pauli]|nr:hypothetical protein [Solirubrobacter pauli]
MTGSLVNASNVEASVVTEPARVQACQRLEPTLGTATVPSCAAATGTVGAYKTGLAAGGEASYVVKFAQSTLAANEVIESAKLRMTLECNELERPCTNVGAFRLTSAGNGTTTTEATTALGTWSTAEQSGEVELDMTSTVADWDLYARTNGASGSPNHGIILRALPRATIASAISDCVQATVDDACFSATVSEPMFSGAGGPVLEIATKTVDSSPTPTPTPTPTGTPTPFPEPTATPTAAPDGGTAERVRLIKRTSWADGRLFFGHSTTHAAQIVSATLFSGDLSWSTNGDECSGKTLNNANGGCTLRVSGTAGTVRMMFTDGRHQDIAVDLSEYSPPTGGTVGPVMRVDLENTIDPYSLWVMNVGEMSTGSDQITGVQIESGDLGWVGRDSDECTGAFFGSYGDTCLLRLTGGAGTIRFSFASGAISDLVITGDEFAAAYPGITDEEWADDRPRIALELKSGSRVLTSPSAVSGTVTLDAQATALNGIESEWVSISGGPDHISQTLTGRNGSCGGALKLGRRSCGQVQSLANSFSTTGFPEGVYTISYRATGANGMMTWAPSVEIFIDNNPPLLTISGGVWDSQFSGHLTSSDVRVAADDTGTGVTKVGLDEKVGNTWQQRRLAQRTCAQPACSPKNYSAAFSLESPTSVLTSWQTGTYTFRGTAEDLALNTAALSWDVPYWDTSWRHGGADHVINNDTEINAIRTLLGATGYLNSAVWNGIYTGERPLIYPTSWTYGGADHTVNASSEINQVRAALGENGYLNSRVWNDLSPADQPRIYPTSWNYGGADRTLWTNTQAEIPAVRVAIGDYGYLEMQEPAWAGIAPSERQLVYEASWVLGGADHTLTTNTAAELPQFRERLRNGGYLSSDFWKAIAPIDQPLVYPISWSLGYADHTINNQGEVEVFEAYLSQATTDAQYNAVLDGMAPGDLTYADAHHTTRTWYGESGASITGEPLPTDAQSLTPAQPLASAASASSGSTSDEVSSGFMTEIRNGVTTTTPLANAAQANGPDCGVTRTNNKLKRIEIPPYNAISDSGTLRSQLIVYYQNDAGMVHDSVTGKPKYQTREFIACGLGGAQVHKGGKLHDYMVAVYPDYLTDITFGGPKYGDAARGTNQQSLTVGFTTGSMVSVSAGYNWTDGDQMGGQPGFALHRDVMTANQKKWEVNMASAYWISSRNGPGGTYYHWGSTKYQGNAVLQKYRTKMSQPLPRFRHFRHAS